MNLINRLMLSIVCLSLISLPLAVEAQGQCHAKVVYNPNGLSHIKFRHWHTSNQNTSKFFKSMTEQKLKAVIAKTLCFGKKGHSSNTHNKVKEYTFKKPIGLSNGGGKLLYTLRVVTNPNGEIVTAFPSG